MNPLLCETALPDYAAIRPEHAEPALREQIDRNRAALAALLTQPALTFASLVEPFEALQARLGRVFAPIAHLNAVQSEPALRAAYNACLEVLTDYQSEVGQNAALAQAYADVLAAEGPALSDAGRRVLQHALREFELAGVRLPEAPQARYRAVMQELAQLQSRFEEQVLDSTRAFRRWIEDEAPAGRLTRRRGGPGARAGGRRRPGRLAVYTRSADVSGSPHPRRGRRPTARILPSVDHPSRGSRCRRRGLRQRPRHGPHSGIAA